MKEVWEGEGKVEGEREGRRGGREEGREGGRETYIFYQQMLCVSVYLIA